MGLRSELGAQVILSSQFCHEDFSAGSDVLAIGGGYYDNMSPAIGSLFRISYPTDWKDEEKYDFDWSDLQNEAVRFEKIDYDKI